MLIFFPGKVSALHYGISQPHLQDIVTDAILSNTTTSKDVLDANSTMAEFVGSQVFFLPRVNSVSLQNTSSFYPP